MTKLKIVLQSKVFICILILMTIINVYMKVSNIPYDSKRLGYYEITGIVKTIKDKYVVVDDMIIYTDTSNIILGNKISCYGETKLPDTNSNFYLFNYRNYLASQKIYYVMDGTCEKTNNKISFMYSIKNMILNRINKLNSKGYLKAFILGDTTSIDDEVNDNYRKNGINHLFSISGMHISFIIGILFFIKRKELIMILLFFYLALLNFPPSMTRAVLFYVITYINKKIKLNIKNIYLFLYMMLVMLWYNPYYIYNIGFIYSYTISFFLILFSEYLDSKNYLLDTLKVSILIFIITIPINIQNNFYLNFATPLLNLVFIPFVSFILFPLSFITFIFPVFDQSYHLICSLLEIISNWTANNLTFIHPFHRMNWMVFIGYYVIICFIMHKIRFGEYKYIGIIIVVLLVHSFYPCFKQQGTVLMLDVGQGDSILVSYPHNKLNILVDTGGYYSSNIVDNVTIPTLYSMGIRELDYLILTHGDYDHAGEAIQLLEKYKVNKVLFNSATTNDLESNIIDYLNKNKIPYEFISDGILKHNNIYLQFLNKGTTLNENDDSLVLYLDMNKYKILLMGDASKNVENNILDAYSLPIVDILKVGHHGSDTSSSIGFIEHIKPKVSIISSGINNRYGHPHLEVLENLQLSDTYVTSIDGAIKISLGDSILVQTVR